MTSLYDYVRFLNAALGLSDERPLTDPPKPGTHASHFGPWFPAIGNDPIAWQRAAVWSHAGGAL